MPDPLPTTAARLITLEDALLRAALAAPAGSSLRDDLIGAAKWANWAIRCRASLFRPDIAALLDATNRLIAEAGISPTLRNVRTTLADVLARLDQPEPNPAPDEAA